LAPAVVGPAVVGISPHQLDEGEAESDGLVGWSTGVDTEDDGMGNVNSEAAQKTDSSGTRQKTGTVVLDGGSSRFDPPGDRINDDDNEGSEEIDDNRKPVDYYEIPHGNIEDFRNLIAKHKVWIRTIGIKEEQEVPAGRDEGDITLRDTILVKYACLEVTHSVDKNYLFQRWVKFEDAVQLLIEVRLTHTIP
jgi:hypothetical protein